MSATCRSDPCRRPRLEGFAHLSPFVFLRRRSSLASASDSLRRCAFRLLFASSWESVQQEEQAYFKVKIVVLDTLAYVAEVQRPVLADPVVVVGGQATE